MVAFKTPLILNLKNSTFTSLRETGELLTVKIFAVLRISEKAICRFDFCKHIGGGLMRI